MENIGSCPYTWFLLLLTIVLMSTKKLNYYKKDRLLSLLIGSYLVCFYLTRNCQKSFLASIFLFCLLNRFLKIRENTSKKECFGHHNNDKANEIISNLFKEVKGIN